MKRIDSANKAENLFGPGKHGFQGGNPAANLPATFLNPDWCNNIQEELANFIEAAGIALDGAQRNQLLLAFQAMTSVDAGQIAAFATSAAPSGWLKANGAAVSRATYAALFANIGTSFGAGDGATTFNLPDLRGEFIRGWDDGRGIDVGRINASGQLDAFQGHEHTQSVTSPTNPLDGGGLGLGTGNWPGTTSGIVQKGGFSAPRVADETRPRNIALLFCIKY